MGREDPKMTPSGCLSDGKDTSRKDEWVCSGQSEVQVPVEYEGRCPVSSWVCESAVQEGELRWGWRRRVI